jgi:hypothetical protein
MYRLSVTFIGRQFFYNLYSVLLTWICDGWVRECFFLLEQSRYEPRHTCLAVRYRDGRTAFLGLGICMSFNTGFHPFRGDLCCFSDFPTFSAVRNIGNILASIRFYFLPFISTACCRLYNTFALLSYVPPYPIILFLCSRISSVQNSQSLRSISMLFLTHRLVGF